MKDIKENGFFELTEKELSQVSGGNSGSSWECHHPGFYQNRHTGSTQISAVGNDRTCTACVHWGVEGPCNLD